MFDGMFGVRIATASNIIDKIRKLQTKMAAKEVAMVVILSELADSDEEKPTRGPTRSWIYFGYIYFPLLWVLFIDRCFLASIAGSFAL